LFSLGLVEDDNRSSRAYVQEMRLAPPVIGALVLLVSGCGDESTGSSVSRAPLVRELTVQSDYGQIYIYDYEAETWQDADTEENNPLMRALNDASDSRRFVGYDNGLVDLITPSQYNWKAPMRIEVTNSRPPLDAAGWDHVVEVPLPLPSGRLTFEASGGGTPIETRVPPNTYRARISGRGYVAGAGEIEGHESYRLQLWPAEEAPPRLIKYWPGFDAMRPNG
jgi:hypothetical protein